jgi:hypothetical protein
MRRRGHDMMGHLRTEAYTYLQKPGFPRAGSGDISIESIDARIAKEKAKKG